MKIVSDIPESLLNQIRRLVDIGEYSSVDSFIRAGVENQLALEGEPTRDNGSSGVKKIGWPAGVAQPPSATGPTLPVPSFADINVAAAKIETNMWMWGQVNRLLPIKAALRIMANASANSNGVLYKDCRDLICSPARQVGQALEREDENLGKQRGEGLAPAFPTGTDVEKARDRFMSVFVGYPRGDKKLVGAMPFLRFVNFTGTNGDMKIGLTESGRQFAQLPSPIFDRNDFERAFSPEEVEFYLDHILRNVAGEADAFRMVLGVISDRRPTREAVHEAIKDRFPEWSDPMINTQRAGTMSRMFELGLFSKEKAGVNVLYRITPEGMRFLKR